MAGLRELLEELRRRGIKISTDGTTLDLDAPKGAVDAELRDRLVAAKADLVAHLSATPQTTDPHAPNQFDLSENQRALYYQMQLDRHGYAYNVGFAGHLDGALDVTALDQALVALTHRHPMLRAAFSLEAGAPIQTIGPMSRSVLALIPATNLTEAEVETQLQNQYQTPFDLEHSPLFRAHLWHLGPDRHTLLITVPHIIIDGWSLWRLLADDLPHAYDACRAGKEPFVDREDPRPFRDHVANQAALLTSADGERLWKRWDKALAGKVEPLDMPTDTLRPKRKAFDGGQEQLSLSPAKQAALDVYATHAGATLPAVLSAAFAMVLARQSGRQNIIIGMPMSGRLDPSFADTLGYFVNPMPLPITVGSANSLEAVLRQAHEAIGFALDHQALPLPIIIERLGLPRDPARNPLFDVNIAVQSPGPSSSLVRGMMLGAKAPPSPFGPLTMRAIALPQQQALFDLTLEAVPADDGLHLSLKYDRSLFDGSTVFGLLSQFEFALGAFAAGAGAGSGSVSCVGDVALDDGSGLVAGRGPVAAWPAGCLLDGVADQVAC
ncbi:MAG: condensation domain-containing protein, partial [Pseudomonadota bacterium]